MVNKEGQFLPESKRAFPTPLAAFFKLSGVADLFSRSGFFNHYALGNLDKDKKKKKPYKPENKDFKPFKGIGKKR